MNQSRGTNIAAGDWPLVWLFIFSSLCWMIQGQQTATIDTIDLNYLNTRVNDYFSHGLPPSYFRNGGF
jgi:hypothetical protein